MAGGLVQLVAYGAQDVYLTGDPQRTFWREKFTKYTNFALESIEQDIIGTVASGSDLTIVLKRNGDLISSIFFQMTLQRGPSGINDPIPFYSAEQLINNLEMYIGGQKVMEFGHEWFRMYWELYLDYTQLMAYSNMVNWGNEQEGYTRTFHLPVPLWFNALNIGNALPLIALQYHEVELRIRLCNFEDMVGVNPNYMPKISCYANYTFLDTNERKWFAQNSHEYLVQQIQTNQFPIIMDGFNRDYNLNLTFNHPCSSLIWCFTPGAAYHGQFTGEPVEQDAAILSPMEGAVVLFNGVQRFTPRRGSYFGNESTWTAFGGTYTSSGVYAYGFGTRSDQPQPSGTCNFSRLDTATLRIRTKACVVADPTIPGIVDESMTVTGANILNTVLVFAPNFNVFRVMSGMGGLAYAN